MKIICDRPHESRGQCGKALGVVREMGNGLFLTDRNQRELREIGIRSERTSQRWNGLGHVGRPAPLSEDEMALAGCFELVLRNLAADTEPRVTPGSDVVLLVACRCGLRGGESAVTVLSSERIALSWRRRLRRVTVSAVAGNSGLFDAIAQTTREAHQMFVSRSQTTNTPSGRCDLTIHLVLHRVMLFMEVIIERNDRSYISRRRRLVAMPPNGWTYRSTPSLAMARRVPERDSLPCPPLSPRNRGDSAPRSRQIIAGRIHPGATLFTELPICSSSKTR